MATDYVVSITTIISHGGFPYPKRFSTLLKCETNNPVDAANTAIANLQASSTSELDHVYIDRIVSLTVRKAEY